MHRLCIDVAVEYNATFTDHTALSLSAAHNGPPSEILGLLPLSHHDDKTRKNDARRT